MADPTNPLAALSDHTADIVERAASSVVAVHGGGRWPASGIHWRAGVIVTAEERLSATTRSPSPCLAGARRPPPWRAVIPRPTSRCCAFSRMDWPRPTSPMRRRCVPATSCWRSAAMTERRSPASASWACRRRLAALAGRRDRSPPAPRPRAQPAGRRRRARRCIRAGAGHDRVRTAPAGARHSALDHRLRGRAVARQRYVARGYLGAGLQHVRLPRGAEKPATTRVASWS